MIRNLDSFWKAAPSLVGPDQEDVFSSTFILARLSKHALHFSVMPCMTLIEFKTITPVIFRKQPVFY